MKLRSLGAGLYVYEHPPGRKGPRIGGRTTVVKLSNGGVLIYSPGPLSPELQAAITQAGDVVGLVAPNSMHHLYLAENAAAFPRAKVFVAPALPKRFPKIRFDEILGDGAPALWADDIAQHLFEGAPFMTEVLWLHKSSRTLVLCDIAFNVHASDHWLTRVMMRLNDAYGKFGPSRIARLMFRDKAGARRSVEKILEWDFDRIVVPHGEIVAHGGKETFRQAFGFLLT